MLPFEMRIHSSKQFAITTKKGFRFTTPTLVCYLLPEQNHNSQFGLIINKSVGGSVQRHRIARQLRHLVAANWQNFPHNSNIVMRTLKASEKYDEDFSQILTKIENHNLNYKAEVK
jgi:ribonuclease P protein component